MNKKQFFRNLPKYLKIIYPFILFGAFYLSYLGFFLIGLYIVVFESIMTLIFTRGDYTCNEFVTKNRSAGFTDYSKDGTLAKLYKEGFDKIEEKMVYILVAFEKPNIDHYEIIYTSIDRDIDRIKSTKPIKYKILTREENPEYFL